MIISDWLKLHFSQTQCRNFWKTSEAAAIHPIDQERLCLDSENVSRGQVFYLSSQLNFTEKTIVPGYGRGSSGTYRLLISRLPEWWLTGVPFFQRSVQTETHSWAFIPVLKEYSTIWRRVIPFQLRTMSSWRYTSLWSYIPKSCRQKSRSSYGTRMPSTPRRSSSFTRNSESRQRVSIFVIPRYNQVLRLLRKGARQMTTSSPTRLMY